MQPFVKWAGGKRQLLSLINERLPEKFDTYYEPFIGGGALLFSNIPNKAVIGDTNTVLINTYKLIKHDVSTLINILEQFENEHNYAEDKKLFYLQMRTKYNNMISENDYSLMAVAMFMYLNKACFNGLYRVNSKGLFNVPFNNSKNLNIFDEKNLNEISLYLQNVVILNSDFEETCKQAKQGDFVFFDSPYAPLKADSFESYTKVGFSIKEHERLACLYRKLTDKGVYCMLTNHNTDLINKLYSGFNIEKVQVKRMINRDAKNRIGEEVIITNY